MARTAEELQTLRDTLIARVASLTNRVTAGDRTVQYDLNAAKTALEVLDKEIAGLSGAKRFSFAQFSKG